MTNVAGIAWTVWTIFGSDRHEPEEKSAAASNIEPINLASPPTAMKISRKHGFLAQKFKTWKDKRI